MTPMQREQRIAELLAAKGYTLMPAFEPPESTGYWIIKGEEPIFGDTKIDGEFSLDEAEVFANALANGEHETCSHGLLDSISD